MGASESELLDLVAALTARLESLEEAHEAVLRRLALAEVPARLPASLPSTAPVGPVAEDDDDDEDEDDDVRAEGPVATSRRKLLTGGALGAAAAAVAAVAWAEPAAAGTGAMQYGGSNNAADFATSLLSTNNVLAFNVSNNGTGDAIVAYTAGSGVGVRSESTNGTTFLGTTTNGIGLNITSQNSYGIYAQSGAGTAIVGASDQSTGVYGASNAGSGISGQAVTASSQTIQQSGVVGNSSTKIGVSGLTDTGVGVNGVASSGIAVRGVAGSGTAVNAQSTSGTGVLGNVTSSSATSPAVRGTTAGNGQGGLFQLSNAGSTGTAVKAVGDHAQLLLAPLTPARPAPTADAVAHARGELVLDGAGDLWVCVVAGTPGTWRKVGGPSTAGQLHLLAAPVRVYDSRPGTSPAVGSKTPLVPNTARVLDARANSSGVAVGATSILVNLLVVNAPAGNGNFTMWANGVAKPASNNMVWGGTAGRFSTFALTALDSAGKFQVAANVATDVVIDVVGYFR